MIIKTRTTYQTDPPISVSIPMPHWPDDSSDLADWHGFAFANKTSFFEHRQQYAETIQWILDNVENWQENVHYRKVNDAYYIKFRNEQDAIIFALKFGASDPQGYIDYD